MIRSSLVLAVTSLACGCGRSAVAVFDSEGPGTSGSSGGLTTSPTSPDPTSPDPTSPDPTSPTDPTNPSGSSGPPPDASTTGPPDDLCPRCDLAEEWVFVHNGPASGDDITHAVAVDGAGNIYVTGSEFVPENLRDWWNLSLTSDGDVRWMTSFDGGGSHTDEGEDLVWTDQGTLVAVGGQTPFGRDDGDQAAVILDPVDGSELLAFRIDDPGTEEAWDGVAANGDLIVVGHRDSQAVVDRRTPEFLLLWSLPVSILGATTDYAKAVAVAADDDIVVAGKAYILGRNAVGFTAQYSPDGTKTWSRQAPSNQYADAVFDVAVLAPGLVVAAGREDESSMDVWIRAYDEGGGPQFTEVRTAFSDDWAAAVTIAASGNILLAGATGVTLQQTDIWIHESTPSGEPLWTYTLDGVDSGFDQALDIIEDPTGSIIVVGQETRWGESLNAFVRKFVRVGG